MDLVSDIGPLLGLVAFAGFAISVLLLFSQARELRRLRDWAGRAPERAAEATERQLEQLPDAPRSDRRGAKRGEPRIDPLVLGALAAAALITAGILTEGFGALGGGGDPGRDAGSQRGGSGAPGKIEVAVLNGSSPGDGSPGVPGLASDGAQEVKEAGFKPGEVADAPSSYTETVVMYRSGAEERAAKVADAMAEALALAISTAEMTEEVAALSGAARVALVLGLDAPGAAEGTVLP